MMSNALTTICVIFQVSWIRRRDWHILSAGDAVFTQDQRFKLHREGSDGSKWTLMIKNLNEEDEGTYVCQVRIGAFCS